MARLRGILNNYLGTHRANVGRHSTRRHDPKHRQTLFGGTPGYKAKHRDTLWGRLAGRPTVNQIRQRNAAPGLFPGFADVWKPSGTYGRPRGSIFADWT